MPSTQGIVNEIKVKNPKAETIMSLEELIKGHIKGINKMKTDLKEVRERYKDSFINNPAFREVENNAKDANKLKLEIKAQIAKEPAVAQLDQNIKDLSFDLKESQKTLSDLLLDYQEQSGQTQLELFPGEFVNIVKSARIVRGK